MPRVRANLLVGGNGMTTLEGSSRPLSNSADRKRFHALRDSACAIVIGGSTYRSEPYSRTPIPLYVSTRVKELSGSNTKFLNLSPLKLVELALSEVDGVILIEGGVNFLSELIGSEVIDEFNITRVQKNGDGYPFSETQLQHHYQLELSEKSGDAVFELWRPRKRLSNRD